MGQQKAPNRARPSFAATSNHGVVSDRPMPAWFVPDHYRELVDFTHQQWADLLSDRLWVWDLLNRWKAGDLESKAVLNRYFTKRAKNPKAALGATLSRSVGQHPDFFTGQLPSPIEPLSIGTAVMLTSEILKAKPRARQSIDSLFSVLECGYIWEGNRRPRIPRTLNAAEFEMLAQPVGALISVDVRRSRPDLVKAFGKWLDEIRPGARASVSKRGFKTRKGERTAEWIKWAIVPMVDICQWLRWSNLTIKEPELVKILKPFIADKLVADDKFDTKRLRTSWGQADSWLSEATLGRLLAGSGGGQQALVADPMPDDERTRMLASRGRWLGFGKK